MTQPSLLNLAPAAPLSLCERLARHFRARPGVWIDGRALATIGGSYGWRTRLSELRFPPFGMTIENRLRRVADAHGRRVTVSEYRHVP